MLKYIIVIIIELLIFAILYTIIYSLIIYGRNIKFQIKNTEQNMLFKKVVDVINVMYVKKLIKKSNKYISPLSLIFISLLIFLICFILVYSFLKVFIASVILSIPSLIFPYIILKLIIQYEKKKIKKLLPVYVINLKGHIASENNIILAIKQTRVEEPLNKYIIKFLLSVERGINIYDSFEMLKEEVAVSEFNNLIEAFKICYSSGGNFVTILEKYSSHINKQLVEEEKEKEKSLSSIITLIVMLILNIFLVVSYVYGNIEYANIIKENFVGRLILDVNAVSCVLCLFFLFKMYKMEE